MTDPDDESEVEKSPRERIQELFTGSIGSGAASIDTRSVTVGSGTEPVSHAEIDAGDVAWLVGRLGDTGELHTEEVRLSTTEGEFVFEADGDRLIVTHDREEDSTDE